jgi:hypothetical protein
VGVKLTVTLFPVQSLQGCLYLPNHQDLPGVQEGFPRATVHLGCDAPSFGEAGGTFLGSGPRRAGDKLSNTIPPVSGLGTGAGWWLLSKRAGQESGVGVLRPQGTHTLPLDGSPPSISIGSKHFVEREGVERRLGAPGNGREGALLGCSPVGLDFRGGLALGRDMEARWRMPSRFFSSIGDSSSVAEVRQSSLTSSPRATEASSAAHLYRADSVFFLWEGPFGLLDGVPQGDPVEGLSSRLSPSTRFSLWPSLQRGRSR